MARRVEITVPIDYAALVRESLDDPRRMDLGEHGTKPGFYVELPGNKYHVFIITIPGPQVSRLLEISKSIGIGTLIGQLVIQTLDCKKPAFSKKVALVPPLASDDTLLENGNLPEEAQGNKKENKKQPLAASLGFQDFAKARLTTEEIYNNILNGATMTVNTWFNLIGACLIAGGGLTTNQVIFIVAAMLVSPIMGPILGMTFGYRIADWKLFKLGFINCFKMTITAFITGIGLGLILGASHDTYGWPTTAMIVRRSQTFNLIVSIIVSGAAGMVLGVSVTSGGVNTLVGTAISAGLLPPIVNSGMLISYGFTYAPLEKRSDMMAMAQYALEFYATHVVIIFIVANFMFYLKEINSRFRTSDDEGYDDLPSLVEYRERLEKEKAAGGGKVPGFLIENLKNEVGTFKRELDNFTSTNPIASAITNATHQVVGGLRRRSDSRSGDSSHHESAHSYSGHSKAYTGGVAGGAFPARPPPIIEEDGKSDDENSVSNPVLQNGVHSNGNHNLVDNAV